MKNILVPIDMDGQAEVLIAKAAELAIALNAKIWLMHIAAPDPDFVGYEVGPQYIRDSRAEELREEHRQLQRYAEELKNDGINAEGLLIQGGTTEMIMEESQKLDIDLIITGHHEHGFPFNLFEDSVAKGLMKKTRIPLMIVPFD